MSKQTLSIRAAVIEVLEAVSGLPASELVDSTSLAEMNLDSLSVVAILSLVEERCATTFDSDASAQITRASNIGGLVAAISRAATPRNAQSD